MSKQLAVLILFMTFLLLLFIWASASKIPPDKLAQIIEYDFQINPTIVQSDTFTVMTYNLGYLAGMTNNQPVKTTASLFKENFIKVLQLFDRVQPDFIGFQEIDFGSKRSFYKNQLDSLARYGGYQYAARAVNWDKNYVPYPYWPPSVHFGRVSSGQAVLSRFPIESNERLVLPRPQNLSFYYDPFYLDRLAQVVKVNIGQTLVIINVHFEAYNKETREQQAQTVLQLCRNYMYDYPLLLIGDLNAPPPQARLTRRYLKKQPSGWTDEQTIQLFIDEALLEEAFPDSIYAQDEQSTYTFSSANPVKKIDYVFYNTNKIEPIDRYVPASTEQASDHLPVVMRFRLVEE